MAEITFDDLPAAKAAVSFDDLPDASHGIAFDDLPDAKNSVTFDDLPDASLLDRNFSTPVSALKEVNDKPFLSGGELQQISPTGEVAPSAPASPPRETDTTSHTLSAPLVEFNNVSEEQVRKSMEDYIGGGYLGEKPKFTDEEVKQATGVARGLQQTAQGLTSPMNLALMAGTGGAPALLQKGVALYFAGQMAKEIPDKIATAQATSDPTEKAQAYTEAALNGLMAALAFGHANGRVREVPNLAPGASEKQINDAIRLAPKPATNAEIPDEMLDGLVASRDAAAKAIETNPGNKTLRKLTGAIDYQMSDVPADRLAEARARIAEQRQSQPPAAPAALGETGVPSGSPRIDTATESVSPQGGRSGLFQKAMDEATAPVVTEPIKETLATNLEQSQAPATAQQVRSDIPVEPQPTPAITYEQAHESALKMADDIAEQVAKGQPDTVKEAARDAAHRNAVNSIESDRANPQFNADFMRKSAMEAAGKAKEKMNESLDAPTGEGERTKLEETPSEAPSPDEEASKKEYSQKVLDVLASLPERDREVVRRATMGGETFEKIAADLGVSRQRAHQIHQAAIEKMAAKMKEAGFMGAGGAMGPVEALEMAARQQTTALKRAVVDLQHKMDGGDEIPVENRPKNSELLSDAEDALTNDSDAGQKIVDKILGSGVSEQQISPKDAATLLVERTRLRNERGQAEDVISDPSATDIDKTQARERFKKLEEQIDRVDRASRRAGTAWSDFGRMYQQVMRDDYTLESLERKARAQKGGGGLSEKEVFDLKELADKYAKKLEEDSVKAKAKEEAELDAGVTKLYEATINELGKSYLEKPAYGKQVFDIARQVVDRWKSEAEQAKTDLRKALGLQLAGIPNPAVILHVAKIIRAKVGEFGLSKAEATAELISEFGPKVKPLINGAWDKMQELIRSEKVPDKVKEAVKKGVSKKGEITKTSTPEDVKAKVKADAVAGDKLDHKLVYDLAKAHVKDGVRGEDALMAKVFNDIKESYPEATERDVRRAFVKYGEEIAPLSKDEVKVALAEAHSLVKIQEDIDRLKEGQDTWKSQNRRDPTDEIRRKTKIRDELLKQVVKEPTEGQLKSREQSKITALENRIKDIDKELRTGEPPVETAKIPDSNRVEQLKSERDAMAARLKEIKDAEKPRPTPEEIAADKAQQAVDRAAAALDRQQRINSGEIKLEPKEKPQVLSGLEKELREKTEELRKAKLEAEAKSPEEAYNERRMKQVEKKIEELKKKLATNDFAKPSKKTPFAKTAEVAKSESDLRAIRKQIEERIGQIKYEGRSIPKRTIDAVTNTLKFITAIKVLGHGTVGMVTHAGGLAYRPGAAMPIWWRNFGKQFKLWTSKAYHDQAIYNLTHDPEFASWKEAGASIDPEKQYTDYGLYAKWLGKLGEGGKRGFDALKLARLELNKADWAKVPAEIKADPESSMEMRKAIASMNNKATGAAPRTSPVGKDVESGFYNLAKNPIAEGLFFAPRLYASRWSRILLDPINTAKTFADWNGSTPAQQEAAKIRTKHAVAFVAGYLGALATNQAILKATGSNQAVNFNDPTKSDWLKFKGAGKEVVADGGLLDPLRLLGQIVVGDLILNRTKNQEYREGTRYQKVTADLAKYARSKLNPTVGLIVDSATGSDYSGRPLPFSRESPKFKDQPKYTWAEWLMKQGPIPMSQGVQVAFDEMRKQGIKAPSAMQILKGAAVSLLGLTGSHITEDHTTDHPHK